MIDPKTLVLGQRVRTMVTGMVGEVIAEVTDRRHYGMPVLRVVEPTDWPEGLLLKDGDYIVQEVLV